MLSSVVNTPWAVAPQHIDRTKLGLAFRCRVSHKSPRGHALFHATRLFSRADAEKDPRLLAFPPPLVHATFLNRPQRFLAEMALPDGTRVLAYCPNPGSLLGCLETGSPALLSDSENPKRKRRYTWQALRLGKVWLGTNTHLANRVVEAALAADLLPGLGGYPTLQREAALGNGIRVDFLLDGAMGPCVVEVKSATVAEDGVAHFPDSVTPRGVRHLDALAQCVGKGRRAALVFVVQREDATGLQVTGRADPSYAEAFAKAVEHGVEVFALGVKVTAEGLAAPRLLHILRN